MAEKNHSGIIIIVSPGFKVHRGATGIIDWRSHGRLSEFVKAGLFTGAEDEWLLFGKPMGEAVGSVTLGGCTLPSGKIPAAEQRTHCQNWLKRNKQIWEKLKLSPLRWMVSEEWQSSVELWQSLFHNENYMDVSALRTLEESTGYATTQETAPAQSS